ncbi:MAG: hypothetical protein M1823_002710 [Watsoniomyces obsoletus]|nr:MAG: hypothetical protein M1823_002710 [Watsoniomyces obsoletus]
MEGLLLVPPDKAAILSRSMWKTRFVTLGTSPPPSSTDGTPSRSASTLRLNSSLRNLKFGSWNASQASVDEVASGAATWISVYKHKGDHDPLTSYPLSSILSCSIQDYAYRKTSSAQPTLIVTVHHGEPKKTKHARRLSQTGSLTKSQLSTLLFRTVPSAPYSIQDWHQTLQEHLQASLKSSRLDSSNNLSTSDSKNSRPSSSTMRPGLPQSQASYTSRASSHPGSALSIRTTHTAVSSPKSNSPQNPTQPGIDSSSSPHSERFHSASPLRPVSPAAAGGGGGPSPSPPPPAPTVSRETILDRAFKMNCIPGATPPPAGETPMNSIARFEALMQDIEARRAYERRPSAIDERGESDEHSYSQYQHHHRHHHSHQGDLIPASAQRALEYIASGQSGNGNGNNSSPARSGRQQSQQSQPPQQQSHQQQLPPSNRRSRPASLALPSNASSIRSPTLENINYTTQLDRRRSSVGTTPSTSSINTAFAVSGGGGGGGGGSGNNTTTTTATANHNKRLSLADFTRRLSSSSSVILARATTTTTTSSSRSSGMSDVSFHCVGEDDLNGPGGGLPLINPAAAWSGISIPSSSSNSHRGGGGGSGGWGGHGYGGTGGGGYGGSGTGGGGGGYGYASSPAGSISSSNRQQRPQYAQQNRHASSGSISGGGGNGGGGGNKIACNRLSGGAFGI